MKSRRPYVCQWCSTGKPLWFKEPFRNPNCKVCVLKPTARLVDGRIVPVRTPAEIIEEWKKARFKGWMRANRTRPKPIVLPDRRYGRSSI